MNNKLKQIKKAGGERKRVPWNEYHVQQQILLVRNLLKWSRLETRVKQHIALVGAYILLFFLRTTTFRWKVIRRFPIRSLLIKLGQLVTEKDAPEAFRLLADSL
jgi:hypothetical protein